MTQNTDELCTTDDICTTVYLCTKNGISTLVRIFSNYNQKDDNSERLLRAKVTVTVVNNIEV